MHAVIKISIRREAHGAFKKAAYSKWQSQHWKTWQKIVICRWNIKNQHVLTKISIIEKG